MPRYEVRTVEIHERYYTLEAADAERARRIVGSVILEHAETEADYPEADEIDMQWPQPYNDLASWVDDVREVATDG